MNHINEYDKKLFSLKMQYAKKLPDMIREIREQWLLVKSTMENKQVKLLYHLTHRLAGSSSSYGFIDVAEVLKEINQYLRQILDEDLHLKDFIKILDGLINEIKMSSQLPNLLTLPPCTHKRIIEPMRQVRNRNQVFIVEDDPMQAENLAIQIGYFGYQVQVFTTLESMLTALPDQNPDAILMDVIFPEGLSAGPEAVAKIRTIAKDEIPVIFISESSDLFSRLQAVRAGGEAYFKKPIDIGALVETIDHLIVQEQTQNWRVLLIDPDYEEFMPVINHLYDMQINTSVVTKPVSIMNDLAWFEPDLILINASLPDCTGMELSRVVRQIKKYEFTPILYVSNPAVDPSGIEDFLMTGDEFLSRNHHPRKTAMMIKNRLEQHQRIKSLMVRDSLTGLYNHTTMKERLEQEISRAGRLNTALSFAMIDLDHFKMVNDNYGHAAGDQVLKNLARLLTQRLRKSDIIGRYGGEEFAVILPDTPAESAENVLRSLSEKFSHIVHSAGMRSFQVTFSAGLASFPVFRSPEEISEAADQALYSAKHAGRNMVHKAHLMPMYQFTGNG